ncbi:hypothetical protein LSAT2_029936 [Lamellibrachia satsuma]|nr:hypothetical protein LSAT2_029936 [Lamellibrachia satsuma]
MIASPGLEYKYVVMKSGKKGKEIPEQIFAKRGNQDHRILRVPTKDLPKHSGDVWHQYDGMINMESRKGVMARLGSYVGLSTTQEHSDVNEEIAISAFLPRWEDVCFDMDQATPEDVSVEEALKQISQIHYCMKHTMNVTTVFVSYLKSYIHRLGQMRLNTDEESQSDATTRLSAAMFVIFVMVQYKLVQSLSVGDAMVLCEALLLRTPTEDTTYNDVEVVVSNFSTYKSYV